MMSSIEYPIRITLVESTAVLNSDAGGTETLLFPPRMPTTAAASCGGNISIAYPSSMLTTSGMPRSSNVSPNLVSYRRLCPSAYPYDSSV